MIQKKIYFILFPVGAALGCSQAQFAADTPQRSLKQSQLCELDDSSCDKPAAPDVCPAGMIKIADTCQVVPKCDTLKNGAEVAFLLDNSSSHVLTDCPNAKKLNGQRADGVSLFQCMSQTQREKAVLSSFDFLTTLERSREAYDVAKVSLVSFPLKENSGFAEHLTRLDVFQKNRIAMEKALEFSRLPLGQTPYGEGFTGAQKVFSDKNEQKAKRILILVSDGFPTDPNPKAVVDKAEILRGQGVEVFTLLVTGKEERSQRELQHRSMLQSFQQANLKAKNRSWYDDKAYSSFEQYMQAVLELQSGVSRGRVFEVSDADSLEKALIGVVGEALECSS